jgi:hypothetical protein
MNRSVQTLVAVLLLISASASAGSGAPAPMEALGVPDATITITGADDPILGAWRVGNGYRRGEDRRSG